MRSALILAALAPVALACTNPDTDPCISVLSASLAAATSVCNSYTAGSSTASAYSFSAYCTKPAKLSSACSCVVTPAATTLTTSTVKATTTTSTTKATTTSSVKSTTATSTTKASTATTAAGGGTTCTVTAYASIASAVSSCSNIALSGISAPASSTILLTGLKTGAKVIFEGTTTFGTTSNSDFDPIKISGTDITITGAAGHVIEGNGAAYWDGLGSNGGVDKPDHFIVLSKVLGNSFVTNLNIKNWPVHCFSVTSCDGLTISGLTLDNSAGNAANAASGTLAAAHNSDGFDFSSSNNIILSNTWVSNQDDCVAVTSGVNVTVTGMTCIGGHGLSIGSVGGKSNNVVTDVTFSDSTISNSQNGCRIKTNSGTTGAISGVTYSNIVLSGITKYGIDVQQDYLNGGPTGVPTNGVTIAGVTFNKVTGTMTSAGQDYYILCGSGSCSSFSFSGVSITGGGVANSCNFPTTTCLVSS